VGAVGEADPLTASAPGFGIRRIVGILVSVRFPGLGHVVVGRTHNSQDSRSWGFVKRDKLLGQAFLIYWSWDPEQERVRWGRIGRWVR
jgi:Signal peptidase, peptidase S26